MDRVSAGTERLSFYPLHINFIYSFLLVGPGTEFKVMTTKEEHNQIQTYL